MRIITYQLNKITALEDGVVDICSNSGKPILRVDTVNERLLDKDGNEIGSGSGTISKRKLMIYG
jgi:hypothetical protein